MQDHLDAIVARRTHERSKGEVDRAMWGAVDPLAFVTFWRNLAGPAESPADSASRLAFVYSDAERALLPAELRAALDPRGGGGGGGTGGRGVARGAGVVTSPDEVEL